MKRRLTQALGGALVFATFGSAWGAYGAYSLGRTDRPWLLAIPLVIGMILIMGSTKLQRRVEALPADLPSPEAEQREARGRKLFTVVNIAQALAIFIAVQVWSNLHRPEYLAPTIAVIVGLHFFVLAKPMEFPSYVVVGGLLCLVAVGVPLAAPAGDWTPLVGLSSAAILWVAALHRLHEVLEGTRPPDSAR